MANILLRIAYDGTNYSGFQSQENAAAIQDELERALTVIYKEQVRVIGSGRTDAGVHARGQTVNFHTPFHIDLSKLPHAINSLLPPDIVVWLAVEVAGDFHARHDARGKLYSYTLDRAPFPRVMKRLYSWHMPEPFDIDQFKKAASLFAGTHDFKAFQAAGGSVTDTTRTLFRVDPIDIPEPEVMVIYFEGSGFLYRMVRLITGSLVRVGRGVLTLSEIKAALDGGSPAAAGPTAPAQGLCLEKVFYDSIT